MIHYSLMPKKNQFIQIDIIFRVNFSVYFIIMTLL